MKRIAQIILGVVIIALVYVIYVQISTPLNFEYSYYIESYSDG